MKLTIVISAFGEDEAIATILNRSLDARKAIVERSDVSNVEIVVVGSETTDRAARVAADRGDIHLVGSDDHCGHGCPVKEGFRVGSGDLVGFLNCDSGDPRFFATLCNALVEQSADVATGSRVGPQSHMPRLRRLASRLYGTILSALSNKCVTDVAGGMMVIRREVLDRLCPRQDDLHVSTAMSARILMDDRITIAERPMPVEERIGAPTLHMVRDAVLFMRIILEMLMIWQPARMLAVAAVASLVVMTLLATHPIEMWLRHGTLPEDMIYRLLFCSLLGTVGIMMLSMAAVTDQWHRLLDEHRKPRSFLWSILDRAYTFRGLAVTTALVAPLLLWLAGGGIWSRLVHGSVDLHWSRVVLAGLLAFGLLQQFAAAMVANLARHHLDQRPRLIAERRRNARAMATVSRPPFWEREGGMTRTNA